ncbi:hypothetical protein DER44DRAFT_820271 [Fusarium oxysporum]|nr:hypothetical protein DER44DRAFT_820271 [Fusarium oxysporum]
MADSRNGGGIRRQDSRSPPFSIQLLSAPESLFGDDELTRLLPASYLTESDDLATPSGHVRTCIRTELDLHRLNKISVWLWIAGRLTPPRPLHHQLLLNREIFITEQMDMHLIWTTGRIFVKPMPRFLLEPRFWTEYLCCRQEYDCSNGESPSRGSVQECECRRLWKCALGFLFSYAALIRHESDFLTAKEKHLLPEEVEWPGWISFVEQLNTEHIYPDIDPRFYHGELRLSRLNKIYRLSRAPLDGYMAHWNQYATFFQDNFAWLAGTTVYIAVVLTAMQANHDHRYLGLRQVAPTSTADTTLDIIAIHGLDTQSPRTWEYRKKPEDGGGIVNWLANADMLPAAIPEARIFTYDWNANYFKNAPVQALLGHADTLLTHLLKDRGRERRPIIFVASCFGGLILAEAINRAAQLESVYKDILLSIAGIVFLATPFRGSDAAKQAQWQVIVGGIMGEQASSQLVDDLNSRDKELRKITQLFAENARRDSIQIPIYCFYETKKTEMLRKFLSPRSATSLASLFKKTQKILVTDDSACLDTFDRLGLDATHSGMNKFRGPTDANFEHVRRAIRRFADKASSVVNGRQKGLKTCHFMVPFGRNKGFVGRTSILDELLKKIPPGVDEDDCQRTAIEGLGGVGKTQIALEAAHRVHDIHPDCFVFWVPAIDAASFENAYREIGQRLEISGIDDEKANIKTLVKVALSQENAGTWLLIIDNADDMQLLFSNSALCDHLSFSRNGSILFTTRNHEVTGCLDIRRKDVITVAEMARVESIALLQQDLKEAQTCDNKSITVLLDFLADLPLAIRQASSFMAKTGTTTTKYLSHCQASDKTLIKLLGRNFEDRNRYKASDNPVATTWLISFEHISRDMPLAVHYLKFMCFLAEKDIPVSLLPPADDEINADEAIGTLKAYAFINQRGGSSSFDIHRLVRLAVQNWLEEKGERGAVITTVIQRLAAAFVSPKHENRGVWMQYLPHAQTALESQKYCRDEEAKRSLLFDVGESNMMLGKYMESEQIYRQALDLAKGALGPEHRATLIGMNNLATVLGKQGKYEEAEQLHRQTLDLKKEVLGLEHHSTLATINNLATVLCNQGKYEEAEEIHRQALDLIKEVLGPEHPNTLTSISNLASVLDNQGKYEEGEQLHRQTLVLTKEVLGPEHPSTLMSMNNLATVLWEQGKYEEGEQLNRQTLDLRKKVLGPEHPDTLTSISNLARVLDDQGKYAEAEQLHRQTLDLRKKVLGPEHPDTLMSISHLATVPDNQGKYAEAEQLHRQALDLRKEVLGPEHPDTLTSISNLANVLSNQGKYEEGELMHRQTLDLRKKVLGPEHPNTLMSMNNLATVLYNQGKYEEAEKMYRQTLDLTKEVLGLEHPNTLMSMNNLATMLDDQGKYEEGEQLHQQTLDLRKKVLGPEHPDTLTSTNNLAKVLYNQGKYEEAEKMYRQTLDLTKEVLGLEHPDTLMSMNNLATMLYNQGKYDEAEEIHRQALDLIKEVLGPEHPNTLTSISNLASVLDNQGKYEEGELMHRQTLDLRKKVLGPEHPDTLMSISHLATVLDDQGKYEESEQLYRQTLDLRKKVLGPEHPDTLMSISHLATVLDDQGKYEESEQLYRQTLDLRKKVLGPEHPSTLTSMSNLAKVLYHQGKYEEAEEIQRQAQDLRKKVLGPEHPNTLMSMNNLATVLYNQGKYDEAEQIYWQTIGLGGHVLS